jgi:hypothetical protein
MKASHCDECTRFDAVMGCKKGHKPRFYAPRHNPYNPDWGHKRRCDDFIPKSTDGLALNHSLSIKN